MKQQYTSGSIAEFSGDLFVPVNEENIRTLYKFHHYKLFELIFNGIV